MNFLKPSKAFKTLNQDLLIEKLDAYSFSKHSLKLLYRYLTKRWQRANVKTIFSVLTKFFKGVPQVFVLRTILFDFHFSENLYCLWVCITSMYAYFVAEKLIKDLIIYMKEFWEWFKRTMMIHLLTYFRKTVHI